jgi:hypothetical protein
VYKGGIEIDKRERIVMNVDVIIQGFQSYITACENNLANILSAEVVDQKAVDATKGMIAGFEAEIEKYKCGV